MKIFYDAEVDALYIEFHPVAPGTVEARPFNDEVIANYGPGDKLVGLEILDASYVLGHPERRLVLEIVPTQAVLA
jgi:uncharacterized protein YuzE